jgi:hypothetical protein
MLSWLFNRRPREPGLRDCPSCRSDCVVPVEYRIEDDEHWWMRLRCGECGSARDVTVPNEDAQRYDRELARGMAAIDRVVEQLDRESMEHEVDTLVLALRHDLIDAFDFQRGGSIGVEGRIT